MNYNFYWKSSYGLWRFFNGLLRLEFNYQGRTNNIRDLSSIDVTTSQSYDTLNRKRAYSEKVGAYDSSLYSESRGHSVKFNAFKHLDKGQRFSLHPYYEIKFSYADLDNFFKPDTEIQNIGLGFIFAFKKKEDKSSFANVELYVTFKDVKNALAADGPFYKRNEIGLRTAFPLNYLFQPTKQ